MTLLGGTEEAIEAGRLLKKEGYDFRIAYTSFLRRGIKTLWLVLEEMDLMWIPVYKSWRLNEKHYGVLQGSNKIEMAKKFGDEKVLLWRRSFSVPPDPLADDDPRNHAGRRSVKQCGYWVPSAGRYVPFADAHVH